jgi:ATP-dependent Lhr-like helicase
MDIEGLKDVIDRMGDGRIRCIAVDTPVPSAFAHEILNANPYAYLDDAPLEERRARAVELRRVLPQSVLSEVDRLDPEAITEVTSHAWPDVRDADDLHDALQTLVALPESLGEPWQAHFDVLSAGRRAGRARDSETGRSWWVIAERAQAFALLFPDARFDTPLPDLGMLEVTREEALTALAHGWMTHVGPTTSAELAERIGVSLFDTDATLLRLEAAGTVLRGTFREPTVKLEWCERRLLARIHRLTLGRLRREIEPVTAADFVRWLCEWQHVAPGSQVTGERGLLEVLRQLQGFEAPASAWEPHLLRRRVLGYDPAVLDQLCLTGAVGWGRLSPHPATFDVAADDGSGPRRRVIPTSAAPITFFVRDEADWMTHRHGDGTSVPGLGTNAQAVLAFLRQTGASFFADIQRGVKQVKLKSEVEAALWELVAAGLVTADGFDNLRALIDPRRRAGQGSGKMSRPRHSTGRWSVLHAAAPPDRAAQIEATCRMLLGRYGVVFRELLARETMLPTWRELLLTFRRLEDRGEVRGGRFVTSFVGEQFALPIAVDSLRASRRQPPSAIEITLAAGDPLNLAGVLLPGERVPAIPGRFLTLRDGAVVDADTSDVGSRPWNVRPA